MEFYKAPVQDVLDELNSSKEGLSNQEAQQRLKKDGPNELQTETKINKLKLFLNQFKSFIIYIMLFALVISVLVGEIPDAIVIAVILIANAVIGYYQEVSAQESLQALKQMGVVNAKVVRDGNTKEIDSKNLVKGDIIVLEPGDKVPADSRIIEATELKVEESALTGESLAVEKSSKNIENDAQLGEQENMLFSSTNIQNGTAKAVVVRIGMETEIGKITEMVKGSEQVQTPLQRRLDSFGQKLGIAVIAICAIVLFVIGYKEYAANGFSWKVVLDALLVAVALAVAAVPSGLPAVVTVALSIGVKKLLEKKALVRNLASVETLGSCNVICSDKTGTLTQNQMTVKKAWTMESEVEVEGSGYDHEGDIKGEINSLLFEIGKTCNNTSLNEEDGEWKVAGDPTEAALLVVAQKAGVEDIPERKDEIPFNSDRKMMSVKVQKEQGLSMYTKGAPDQILAACNKVMKGEEVVDFDESLKEEVTEQVNQFSQEAMRVLAFACKDLGGDSDFKEENLTFVGLQAMIDPPRPDVLESIHTTDEAGIRVVMITGDYKETAKAIGHEVGIEGDVLTGQDLEGMSDEELKKQLDNGVNIFARVIPEHKQKIITALQEQGNIVSMTGDGVNDAPALKKANIGVAVGSGTDVAKEASDFVLLDDSFTNIVHAVEQGRGIYDNIQKAIMHLLSGNLSEVLIIFIATLMGWNLPLTAILLLWINLISDGAPALALAVDPYSEGIMHRKPKDANAGIMPRRELILVCLLAVFSTVGGLGLFYWAGGTEKETLAVAQTTIFTFLMMSEFVLLFAVRQFFGNHIFTNYLIWLTMGGSLILQVLLIYVPWLSDIFGLEALGLKHWAAIGIAIAGLIILSFATQAIVKRGRDES